MLLLQQSTEGLLFTPQSTDDVSWLNQTIFGGKMTMKQLVGIISIAVIIILVLALLKNILKFIIIGGLIIYAGIHFGIISPAQVKDIGKQITANGIEQYQKYINASDNIRAVTVNKETKEKGIEIRIKDKWVNIDKISSVINGDGLLTVVIDGESYTITDPETIELIKQFTEGNFIQKIFNIFDSKEKEET